MTAALAKPRAARNSVAGRAPASSNVELCATACAYVYSDIR
jgi:hypothetical protein